MQDRIVLSPVHLLCTCTFCHREAEYTLSSGHNNAVLCVSCTVRYGQTVDMWLTEERV